MKIYNKHSQHRLRTAVVLTIVSLPTALPLLAYANRSIRLDAAPDAPPAETAPDRKEPGKDKDDGAKDSSGKEGDARTGEAKEGEAAAEEVSPALHVNQLHTSKDGIMVKFIEVTADSRCPADVRCIWAGDAAVVLELSKKGVEPTKVTLHTYVQPREVVYAGKTIALSGVAPYPNIKNAAEQKDYEVRVRFLPMVAEEKKAPDTPPTAPKTGE
jgi:hypothetical protein